eukprot:5760588-Pleurochrysis_carterae.AAC.3
MGSALRSSTHCARGLRPTKLSRVSASQARDDASGTRCRLCATAHAQQLIDRRLTCVKHVVFQLIDA